jgi:hypothetical protein
MHSRETVVISTAVAFGGAQDPHQMWLSATALVFCTVASFPRGRGIDLLHSRFALK